MRLRLLSKQFHHASETAITYQNIRHRLMSGYPVTTEIKEFKFHFIKCISCKAELFVRATEKMCPVCGGSLSEKGRS
jgi:rRNA maturation endonuclease Nob1